MIVVIGTARDHQLKPCQASKLRKKPRQKRWLLLRLWWKIEAFVWFVLSRTTSNHINTVSRYVCAFLRLFTRGTFFCAQRFWTYSESLATFIFGTSINPVICELSNIYTFKNPFIRYIPETSKSMSNIPSTLVFDPLHAHVHYDDSGPKVLECFWLIAR